MPVLLCCGRRTLISRKAMRRRVAENAEMSGQNYFREDATKQQALRNSDQEKIPRYAEFEVVEPSSVDRLPLNPSKAQTIASSTDRSNETFSIDGSSQRSYRMAPPIGLSPYGNGAYPPAPRVAHPFETTSLVRTPSDQRYPQPPGAGHRPPPPRSNVSSNNTSRPLIPNNDLPMPPPVVNTDRPTSSIYSDYVPPRRQWGSSSSEPRSRNEDRPGSQNHYHSERPGIDTYNLDRDDRMIDNPYTAARRMPAIDPIPVADNGPNQSYRSSDAETMVASYYEDVDPRFDDALEDERHAKNVYRTSLSNQQSYNRPSRPSDIRSEVRPVSPLHENHSYESIDQRSQVNGDDDDRSIPRSPTASTSSHFTSVSQRGVNPRWQPQPPPQFIGSSNANDMYTRRNYRKKNDQMNFLAGNPDFELPVTRYGKVGGATLTVPVEGGGRYPLKI